MKRSIILALAVLAAGCARTPPPAVQIQRVEVPVVRVEKCVARSDIPARPRGLPRRPKTVSGALDAAVAKVLEWQGYGERADAVMKGCAG